jgi:hypothetical protein
MAGERAEAIGVACAIPSPVRRRRWSAGQLAAGSETRTGGYGLQVVTAI